MTTPDVPAEREELLPCPFCGEEPHLYEPAFVGDDWQVGCQCGDDEDERNPGAIWRNGKTFEEVAARWNRRSAPQEARGPEAEWIADYSRLLTAYKGAVIEYYGEPGRAGSVEAAEKMRAAREAIDAHVLAARPAPETERESELLGYVVERQRTPGEWVRVWTGRTLWFDHDEAVLERDAYALDGIPARIRPVYLGAPAWRHIEEQDQLRAAHQDADARRLDAIERALTDLDLYADGIAIAAYIVSATGELGYCIGHLDGDTAHFGDDADGPTLRAAIDAMAPGTQTEAPHGE